MNAQTAFAQRLFAILNGKPIEEMKRLDAAPVPPPEDSKWHEDGPCEAPYGHGPFNCPGCMKEEQEHQLAVLQAKMEPPSFKLRGLLSLCHDHDDDEACTVACRIKDSE